MKDINDQGGHNNGDSALRDAAEIIRRATAGEDAFAMRYGGDEFLVISKSDLIPKLEWELEQLRSNGERSYDLALSMGSFVAHQDDRLSMAEAITCADVRMYKAKKARKQSS